MNWYGKVNVDYLSDTIINDALANMECETDEEQEAGLKKLEGMTARQIFERYLTWNGIIGYAPEFMSVFDSLQKAQNMLEQDNILVPNGE